MRCFVRNEIAMALLIDSGVPEWMTSEALRARLAPLLPEVTIYCAPPENALPDVRMLAVAGALPDAWALLPNVQCVQKLGAGVDLILDDSRLPPHIRVTRMAPEIQGTEIAEYCLSAVLMHQRDFLRYRSNARDGTWQPLEPRKTAHTTVAVLGLGHIGRRIAELFFALGFTVRGWSRRAKSIPGVHCASGPDGLAATLADSDYVIAILPSTAETRDLFDRARFDQCKPGAVLINVGRGDLIVAQDLLKALERGRLAGAVLDVFREEPLPAAHPLWSHDNVLITPHVSGWHIDGGFEDVAENYRRLVTGRALLHEVDRRNGY